VTIDDPPHNRMSLAFMDALESFVAEIAAVVGVRAVVMTAAGEDDAAMPCHQ
jgi:enoyl-CoA hydratase/carnithine racemase